ncbi:type IV pilus assembly protein PilQ [Desulfonatronum thiosulfatophilum]|uniref:Type IV pilus assembly protein PilQ n=1 Tax=Desulfonatronum thiosulfatophilum TaxID=617002 RepID=A0A1G6CNW9_9BACT|nr:type IV pilus secretin PilQ [Desulfonatronum thiosulfatophilum]SDB34512.1 type IV pilus assembly protein PilQ [Desulfonatronum thiosulfatophilum]
MRRFFTSSPLFALVCLVLLGCSAKPEVAEMETFFDDWRLMAEVTRGHSPLQELEAYDVAEFVAELEPELEVLPEPPLPTTLVNLQLHDVPLGALLQALSRAAGQNIVFGSTINAKNVSILLDNVPWDQAFRSVIAVHGLTYVWDGDILRVLTLEDMQNDLRVAEVRRGKFEQARETERLAPLIARVVRINYGEPAKLKDSLLELITKGPDEKPQGSINVDDHSNSLVIKASRDDQDRILNMIRHLDKPRSQIQIKATIVEATKETARDLGVQWGGRRVNHSHPWMLSPSVGLQQPSVPLAGAGNYPLGDPATPSFNTGQGPMGMASNFPANLAAASAGFGLNFIIGSTNYLEVQLSALQQDGKLNILSSPSITTMDNQMAYTENGERVPYVTYDRDGDKTVRFEDAVLRLEITPHTVGSNLLRMKINVKKDEVDFTRQVDGNPLIIKKQTETNLIVENGETIVISGLTKQRDTFDETGVPGLKNVTGLGWLFKRENKGQLMEDVLIFITPTILPTRAMQQTSPFSIDPES